MTHPDLVWDYITGQAVLATLTLDSLAQYDMLAPIHPRHESPDHWPEGWNPPVFGDWERLERHLPICMKISKHGCDNPTFKGDKGI